MKSKRYRPSEATILARHELCILSAELHQTKLQAAAIAGVHVTTNELILGSYKGQTGAKEFLRMDEWRNLGFKVKRGEKAYRVWGSPILMKEKPVEGNEKEESKGKPFEHWPMCCLFNEQQVEKYQGDKQGSIHDS